MAGRTLANQWNETSNHSKARGMSSLSSAHGEVVQIGRDGPLSAELFCQRLADDLSTAESGIAFLYETLERVLDNWELHDVVLVVDRPLPGRQLFRPGRKPVGAVWSADQIQQARPGLYADPPVISAEATRAIASLCQVALKIDLLQHDAAHDPLTGLLNRRSFETLLDQAVARTKRYGWSFALAVLDINDFKTLNDKLGHAAGDAVLEAVGMELRQSLRGGDVAARMGGDEFALILNEGGPGMLSGLLDRLVAAVQDMGISMEVGFSAGVATAPADASEAETLYLLADRRLYEAKGR